MFQVDEAQNPMLGLEGRSNLLKGLGTALKACPEYFGNEGRPGNMIGWYPSILPPQMPVCTEFIPTRFE